MTEKIFFKVRVKVMENNGWGIFFQEKYLGLIKEYFLVLGGIL